MMPCLTPIQVIALILYVVCDVTSSIGEIIWKDVWTEAKSLYPECFGERTSFKCNREKTKELNVMRPRSASSCGCDSSCGKHGGCCLDKAEAVWNQGIRASNRYKCGTLSKKLEGFIIVRRCNSTYGGSSLEKLCLKNTIGDSYSYIQDIPVISRKTKTSYENYYCALCNDDADDLVESSLDIECSIPGSPLTIDEIADNFKTEDFLSRAIYHSGSRYWHQSSSSSPHHGVSCSVTKIHYENMTDFQSDLERCSYPIDGCKTKDCSIKKHEISECHETWPIKDDFIKCRSYTLRLYNMNAPWKTIKNPHCAQCNHLEKELYSCSEPVFFSQDFLPGIAHRPILPLSRIIRIPVSPWLECDKSEIWINEKCEQFLCGPDLVKTDGKCTNPQEEKTTRNLSEVFFSCPKVILDINDTKVTENGTLAIGQHEFDKSLYEIVNGTSVMLCIDSIVTNIDEEKSYITLVVFMISEACLLFHIAWYLKSPKPKSTHKNNLLNLSLSLFFAQWIFTFGLELKGFWYCFSTAAALNALWLSSFFWMNVLSYDIFRTFHSKGLPSSSRNIFYFYLSYAWGVPMMMVAAGIAFDLIPLLSLVKPNYGMGGICWIGNPRGQLLFFLVPVSIIILANCVLFVWTSWNIYRKAKETRFAYQDHAARVGNYGTHTTADQKIDRVQQTLRFSLYAKLGLLQGVTWGLMFIAYFVDYPIVWEGFTIVTGLQGAYIFFFFDLRKAHVKEALDKLSNVSKGVFTYVSRAGSSSSSKYGR